VYGGSICWYLIQLLFRPPLMAATPRAMIAMKDGARTRAHICRSRTSPLSSTLLHLYGYDNSLAGCIQPGTPYLTSPPLSLSLYPPPSQLLLGNISQQRGDKNINASASTLLFSNFNRMPLRNKLTTLPKQAQQPPPSDRGGGCRPFIARR
jgi:hypothetical protein